MKFSDLLVKIRRQKNELVIETLSDKSKEYFLSSIQEDIENKHINGSNPSEYQRIADEYCKIEQMNNPLKLSNEIPIFIFILRKGNVYIGCSMIYQFSDYIEFMYIHISQEYRRKKYGTIFYNLLEERVEPSSVMKIRCYKTSSEGINFATKLGYTLENISEKNTRTFIKKKEALCFFRPEYS